MKRQVIIATPSLVINDAVSTDVYLQAQSLRNTGFSAEIYAENADQFFAKKTTGYEDATEAVLNPENILLLHHSIYWAQGEELFNKAKCKIAFRYHNITPAEFFPENFPIQREITLGRMQNIFFVNSGKVSVYLSASKFNSMELVEVGADSSRCKVLAPFSRVADFNTTTPDPNVLSSLVDDKRIKLLFVGRVAPNKGQLNLVQLVERYVQVYGQNICLYLVGKLGPKSYVSALETYINRNHLGSVVRFIDNASFSALAAYFQGCDFFVMMSEHEGFGVPIVEAQVNSLPVLAYARTAVPETVGRDQILLESLDYDEWSAAIKVLSEDKAAREFLIQNGLENVKRFDLQRLSYELLDEMNLLIH